MSKLEKGFLQVFCDYLSDVSVPSVFCLWSGVHAISSVLARECWLDTGFFITHPNLYTLLIGDAASGKSVPINAAVKLLKQMDCPPRILGQKMTPEGLISKLKEAPLTIEDNIILEEQHVGCGFIREYGTLIDKNSFQNGMATLLTDLWDAEDDFEYITRTHGTERVIKPCLNVVAGVTPGYLKSVTQPLHIEQGLMTRFLYIEGLRPKRFNPRPQKSSEIEKLLVEDLNRIAQLEGAFVFSPEAELFYDKISEDWDSSGWFHETYLKGYAGRRMRQLSKLSVIVSASFRDTQIIEKGDIVLGLRLLTNMEQNLPNIMRKITMEQTGDICEEIVLFFKKKKCVRKAQVITKFMYKMEKRHLDAVLDLLVEGNVLKTEGSDLGNPTYIYLGR